MGLLLLKSVGAPLGEPVADDFDFLVAGLRGEVGFLSGGGSQSFWRPLPHQLYYAALGRWMMSHPWVTPVLHSALLLAAGYLLILGLRGRLGLNTACAAGTFVLLAEPLRAMISWPSHAVELGSILFMGAAVWALGTRRHAWLVPIAAAGLLVKETAAPLLALLPFWPDAQWSRRSRITVGLGLAACIALWAVAYLWVARTHELHPPGSITTSPAAWSGTLFPRMSWAIGRSAAVTFGTWHLGHGIASVVVGLYLVLGVFLAIRWRRGRSSRSAVTLDGLSWWSLACLGVCILGLTVTYPVWGPHRAVPASVGAAIALSGLAGRITLGAPHALVVIKALTLALAAAPISIVGVLPPESGNALDFERLTRLQLLSRDIRMQLAERVPSLQSGAVVVQRNFPHAASYALGGSHALQAWRRDTTLRWVGYEAMVRDPRHPVSALVDFEAGRRPAVSIVPWRAAAFQILGDSLLSAGRPEEALAAFDQALSSLGELSAPSFEASCRYRRAVLLARQGRGDVAVDEARLAVRGTSAGIDARFLLAVLLADRGDLAEARVQVDSILLQVPGEPRAANLRAQLSGLAPEPR